MDVPDDRSVDSRNLSDLDDDDEEEVAREGSDDDGEDLVDNAEADYRAMPNLDRYEEAGLEEEVYEDITDEERIRQRIEAERELDRRDAEEGRVTGRRRLPGALYDDVEDEEESGRPARRRRTEQAQAGDLGEDDEEQVDVEIDLEAVRGPLKDWVASEPVQREVIRQFKKFLRTFTDDNGELVYRARIQDMCRANRESLDVSFGHISKFSAGISMYLCDAPKETFDIVDKTTTEVAKEMCPDLFEHMGDIHVRLSGLPLVEQIRDIRQYHLNTLVKVSGVVTRRTSVFPQLEMVKWDCAKCNYVLGPFYQNTETEIKPASCPQCQGNGPFSVNVSETVYRNYQKLTLQESPGSVPAGRLPRHKEIILLRDLIDIARPGEEIKVTGVYTNSYDAGLNARNGFPVFTTLIEANHVEKNEDHFSVHRLTDEDKLEIHRLARDPRIGERICKSIAPSIYGHANIKMGLALTLFGGQEKHPSGNHRLRGDINMLLLGDPGTAKSQFLKYVQKTAMRAVYTTGKGASAVGLTASVQKDPITREWTLEGGALVLADRGICLIDEFDKMNDQDRVSIHEAMEQQSISISKAGIVTQLQARCSVIAAANPIGGRYDASRTFSENVELTDPILSRFDILCVVRDIVDPVSDGRLAQFVVNSHMASHPDMKADAPEAPDVAADDPDVLPQDILRKYITYAKQNCHPKLSNADYDKICEVYAVLRRESGISHGMPIAVRHLESIIRMSEAHAAIHLREYVNDEDTNVAIRVMLESFISTQKKSVQAALQKKFRRYMSFKQDFLQLTLHTLQAMMRDKQRADALDEINQGPLAIPCRQLEERLRQYNISDLQPFYDSALFATTGFSLDQENDTITLPRI